jgi:hypothetical protein
MAKVIHSEVRATLSVTLGLTEAEARALDGIFGYNADSFLKVFYEKMGRAYVQPHEAGVRSLHNTIRGVVSGPLAEVDRARKAMLEAARG